MGLLIMLFQELPMNTVHIQLESVAKFLLNFNLTRQNNSQGTYYVLFNLTKKAFFKYKN